MRNLVAFSGMDDPPAFYDPWGDVAQRQNRLPHWEQTGATYFITFRLADALPRELLFAMEEERAAWLANHAEPWSRAEEAEYHERFSGAVERWLDAGHGSCLFRAAACSAVVGDALGCFDGVRYAQHAWVVMPNHVHTLFSLHPDWRLDQVVQGWKSVSARRLGGPCRQKDYFDRLVRDRQHFANCARYIRRNPAKAGLRGGEYLLHESELVRQIE